MYKDEKTYLLLVKGEEQGGTSVEVIGNYSGKGNNSDDVMWNKSVQASNDEGN